MTEAAWSSGDSSPDGRPRYGPVCETRSSGDPLVHWSPGVEVRIGWPQHVDGPAEHTRHVSDGRRKQSCRPCSRSVGSARRGGARR